MKKKEKKKIFNDMLELGLAALSHINRMDNSEKWDELSVLLTAHATEILFKAKIAEEHPLLIFEKFPKSKNDELSLANLFDEGHTIEWNILPDMLWATVDCKLNKKEKESFKKFGNLRNGIQHFGAVPTDTNGNGIAYMESTKFIYNVLDPLLYKWWKIYVIDCSQDYNSDIYEDENTVYWDYIKNYIIRYEINFHVSPHLAYNTYLWWDESKNDTSIKYRNKIQKQIDKIISQS